MPGSPPVGGKRSEGPGIILVAAGPVVNIKNILRLTGVYGKTVGSGSGVISAEDIPGPRGYDISRAGRQGGSKGKTVNVLVKSPVAGRGRKPGAGINFILDRSYAVYGYIRGRPGD